MAEHAHLCLTPVELRRVESRGKDVLHKQAEEPEGVLLGNDAHEERCQEVEPLRVAHVRVARGKCQENALEGSVVVYGNGHAPHVLLDLPTDEAIIPGLLVVLFRALARGTHEQLEVGLAALVAV